MTGVDVKLSQGGLFFPLPFTNATIENVVQIKNLLTPDTGNSKVNVISFKVLSAVRHRYSVRPAIGFIAPGDAVTINFSLDPESIRNNADAAARTLPNENTKDVIFIDFAVVCSGASTTTDVNDSKTSELVNGKYLTAWLAAGGGHTKGINERKTVMSEAAQFWKARGAAKSGTGDSTSLRKKLACVFAAREAAPDSLVVCMKAEGGQAGAAANAATSRSNAGGAATTATAPAPALPTSRPPTTSLTHRDSTAPPDSLPRRASESTPASSTPRTSRMSPTLAAKNSLPPAAPAKSSPSPGGRHTLADVVKKAPFSLQQAAMAFSGEKAEKRKALWRLVMNYKIPYPIVALCIVLALLCGVFESHTFLSWLIAGK